MAWILLLLLTLSIPAVYCRSHTLYYQITMTSAPTPGPPQFSIIVYVNDIQYGRYNCDIGRAEALIPISSIPFSSLWMVSVHMEHQTKVAQEYEIAHRQRLNFLMGVFNTTNSNGDIHVYQTNNACELRDDGTISGYQEIAFDGKELLVFDKERVTFVPVTQEAVMVAQLWNKRYDSTYTKIFMEIDCIEHMKMYLPYISTDLGKKVPPNVKVSSSESESGIKLHCWVYGFYPRDVEVKWIKNETDEIYSEKSAEILPNPDGTYQIRVSVEVVPEEGATYSCHVSHISLEDTLVAPFEPNKRSHLCITVPASGMLLLLLLLIGLGVFRFSKSITKDPMAAIRV
nr:class I histocompatibility antigen - African clawed frog [Xenopus laevis]